MKNFVKILVSVLIVGVVIYIIDLFIKKRERRLKEIEKNLKPNFKSAARKVAELEEKGELENEAKEETESLEDLRKRLDQMKEEKLKEDLAKFNKDLDNEDEFKAYSKYIGKGLKDPNVRSVSLSALLKEEEEQQNKEA